MSLRFYKVFWAFVFLLVTSAGLKAQNIVTIGTGTVTVSNTTYPAPYGNFYFGAKHQFIIRASEIINAGGSAGFITSLAFDVATPVGTPLTDFTVKIGSTTDSVVAVASGFAGNLTTVLTEPSFTEVSGWNTHVFTTNYLWDGTSNIIIETCFNNTGWTTNAIVNMTAMPYNASIWYRADAAGVCANSLITGVSVNRPNMQLGILPLAGRDARVQALISPLNLNLGANTVTTRVQSLAADPIASVDIAYQVNNDPPVVQNAVSISPPLNAGQAYDHIFLTPLNITTPGTYTLKTWISNANGLGPDNNTSNDTIERVICTGLSGFYSVGGGGSDYASIQDAVNALNLCGIIGPVTFQLNAGTYIGSYTMNNVVGASATNQITFLSATGQAADVILIQDTAAGASRSIFTVNGTSGVNFNGLTFRRTLNATTGTFGNIVINGSNNVSVTASIIEDLTPFSSTPTTSQGVRLNDVSNALITNNSFSGFNTSIFLTGPTSNGNYEEFNTITANNINNYRTGIFAENQSLAIISDNTIRNNTTLAGYGISVARVVGMTVNANKVLGTIGTGGLQINNANDSSGLALNTFSNNVISGSYTNSATFGSVVGINVIGSADAAAVVRNNRDALQIVHNTVNLIVNSATTTNYGLFTVGGGSNTNPAFQQLTIMNNHIVGTGVGSGIGVNAVAASFSNDSTIAAMASNYNNFFLGDAVGNPLTNFLFRNTVVFPGTTFATVGDWTTAVGQDANSLSTSPFFATNAEPIPSGNALNDQGTPIASVTLDILGLPRSATTPDIGAYEFNPRTLDVGLTAARGTVAGCNEDSTTVVLRIANFGTTAITSLNVGYIASSGAFASVALSNLNLAFGDTLLYSFPQRALLLTGLNTITAFVELTGDQLLANDSATFTLNKFPLITSFPYFENWENGSGGWAASGTNSSWALGTPNNTIINSAFSGSNAWVTNLTGLYNNSEFSFLQSPCFDLAGIVQPFVEFKLWWESETSWDGLNLQYSIDGGTTWDVLGSVGSGILNWYNQASVSSSQNQPVWSGSGSAGSLGYVTVRHSLNSLPANSTVIFRLRFTSDGSFNFEGFAVDDFVVSFPPPADMSVVSITSPVTSCEGQVSDTVRIRVLNDGTVAQSNFPVSYVVNGGTPVTETFTSTINPGDTLTYTFSTLIAGGLPVGTNTITAYPSLTGDIIFNNDTVRRSVTVVPSINTFPYVQGFENGNGGWTTGGNNSSWALGAPNDVTTNSPALIGAYNGNNAWVTNLAGNYNNSEASWLMSPCFDLSSMQNVRVRFGLWYSTEASWDGGNLAYSIDGGNTWTVAGSLGSAVNWYNAASVSSSQTQPVWAGNGGGAWLPAEITLPQLANQANVRLRFQFFSDGSFNAFSGIGIDSFVLELPTDPIVNAVTVATDSCITSTRAITADITQFRQLTSVNLHYDVSGTSTYTALPMTRVGTTNEWTATIPMSTSATRNYYFVSAVDSLGLTDTSNVVSYIDDYLGLTVFPANRTVNAGDTVVLRATALGVANVKITEVVQFRTGTGATSPYPAYAVGQDLVEISNLGNGQADLSGFTFEVFGTGGRSYTFPSGAVVPGNSVLILHIGAGTDSPSDAYYNTGGANDAIFSTQPNGYLLKDAGGQHVDAVATNGYTFDVASGVTAAQWSGSIPNSSAGVSRIESDNNTAADWVISSATNIMTVGALNPGMVLSTPAGGIVWNTTPPTNGDTLLVGPFTTPGTYTYIATVSDGRCSVSDTATIIVQAQLPDIGVTQIISNSAPQINQPQSVTAVIRNFSTTTPATGFDVAFRVNGVEINAAAIARTVAPQDTIHHTFALAWTPTAGGRHNMCAFTRFTDDPNLVNDTTCVVYLGVNVTEQNDLVNRVYPNPANEFVVFDFANQQGVGTLEIRDQLGKVVYRSQVDLSTGSQHEVQTASLAAGVYNYRFVSDQKAQNGQVVIRR